MKLIFIYGPPASGKLTIAEKLSERTGIPLFHNHLSRDLAEDIYKENLLKHYDLVDQLRFTVLDYCSKNGTDLIFTYVYAGEEDDDNVRALTKVIEDNQGDVVFIELTANRGDLIKRADNESRKKYKKLTDTATMAKITEEMDIYSIPFVHPFRVNTSLLTADEVAEVIIEQLHL